MSRPIYLMERPGTHCIGGWVGTKAGLDERGKSRPPPPGFDPQTVQPVAGRYTDYPIRANKYMHGKLIFCPSLIQCSGYGNKCEDSVDRRVCTSIEFSQSSD